MRLAVLVVLLLSACKPAIQPGNVADVVEAPVQPLSPGERPVRIGEGGANLAACPSRGAVTATEPLAVRASPFVEAEMRGDALPGQSIHVCTRSIDQRWLGVVVPRVEGEAEQDCGLSARVETPRAYDGPCLSGWVASSQVRLTAR